MNSTRSSSKPLLRGFLALMAGSGLASAAVPATLTQQGRLLDSDGNPVTASVAITFTIYDAASDGASLWTEDHNVTPDDGYFSVQLGADAALDATVFDGSTRYLGVTVGSDAEMEPRQAITSVPYAFSANFADLAETANTVDWGGITGFPAECPAPQFLRGYTAAGAAVCAAPQSLSCTVRFSGLEAAATQAFVSCNAGEVQTGGGCYTTGTLRASYRGVCTSGGICLCPAGGPCTNDFICNTAAAASIRAYATCCTMQ